MGEAGIVILPFEIKNQNQHSENASDSAKEWQKPVDGPQDPLRSTAHFACCFWNCLSVSRASLGSVLQSEIWEKGDEVVPLPSRSSQSRFLSGSVAA